MVYLIFSIIVASSFLVIIRDKNTFFNYLARIEALSIVLLVSTLSLVKVVDRFFAVLSASAKSFT
jgi:hypothetical protein